MTATDDYYDVRNAGVEALKALALEGLLSATSINSNLTSQITQQLQLMQNFQRARCHHFLSLGGKIVLMLRR
jgi:hypothetical protein